MLRAKLLQEALTKLHCPGISTILVATLDGLLVSWSGGSIDHARDLAALLSNSWFVKQHHGSPKGEQLQSLVFKHEHLNAGCTRVSQFLLIMVGDLSLIDMDARLEAYRQALESALEA